MRRAPDLTVWNRLCARDDAGAAKQQLRDAGWLPGGPPGPTDGPVAEAMDERWAQACRHGAWRILEVAHKMGVRPGASPAVRRGAIAMMEVGPWKKEQYDRACARHFAAVARVEDEDALRLAQTNRFDVVDDAWRQGRWSPTWEGLAAVMAAGFYEMAPHTAQWVDRALTAHPQWATDHPNEMAQWAVEMLSLRLKNTSLWSSRTPDPGPAVEATVLTVVSALARTGELGRLDGRKVPGYPNGLHTQAWEAGLAIAPALLSAGCDPFALEPDGRSSRCLTLACALRWGSLSRHDNRPDPRLSEALAPVLADPRAWEDPQGRALLAALENCDVAVKKRWESWILAGRLEAQSRQTPQAVTKVRPRL